MVAVCQFVNYAFVKCRQIYPIMMLLFCIKVKSIATLLIATTSSNTTAVLGKGFGAGQITTLHVLCPWASMGIKHANVCK